MNIDKKFRRFTKLDWILNEAYIRNFLSNKNDQSYIQENKTKRKGRVPNYYKRLNKEFKIK